MLLFSFIGSEQFLLGNIPLKHLCTRKWKYCWEYVYNVKFRSLTLYWIFLVLLLFDGRFLFSVGLAVDLNSSTPSVSSSSFRSSIVKSCFLLLRTIWRFSFMMLFGDLRPFWDGVLEDWELDWSSTFKGNDKYQINTFSYYVKIEEKNSE